MNRLNRLVGCLVLLLPIITFSSGAQAALTTAQDVAANLKAKLEGPNLTISNFTVTQSGNAAQLGTFDGGLDTVNPLHNVIGVKQGVILSTGNVSRATGSNNDDNAGSNYGSSYSDPDLTSLAGNATNDVVIIDFDFTPLRDDFQVDFVFASEEYPEYVCSTYNDVFGFFISGPGINGTFSNSAINLAKLPDGSEVAIKTVNPGVAGSAAGGGSNCVFNNVASYINNGTGTTPADNPNTQYDGLTQVLQSAVDVIPNATYHVKIAIADAGDGTLDSAVFLRFFSSPGPEESAVFSTLNTPLSTLTPNGTVIANPVDPNGPIDSAEVIGTLPAGLSLNTTTGEVTVGDNSQFVEGDYNLSIKTTDFKFGVTTTEINFVIAAASESDSIVNASSAALSADGSSTTTITFQSMTADGVAIKTGGDVVSFATTLGSIGAVTDNGNGTYTATFTSAAVAGQAIISATLNGNSVAGTTAINIFTPGVAVASESLLTPTSSQLLADGSSTTTVIFQAVDGGGNNLTTGGDIVLLSSSAGSLGAVSYIGNGQYSATLTSSNSVETATITGSINGDNVNSTQVNFYLAGVASGALSQVTSDDANLTADGTSSTSITLQAKDGAGSNVNTGGDTVVIISSAGSLSNVIDNNDGTYSATLTAPVTTGVGSISASINGESLSAGIDVTFIAGSASTLATDISVGSSTIVADGENQTSIIIQAKDANGNNLTSGGDTLIVSTTTGTVSSVKDKGNGLYTAVLTGTTTVGSATLSATLNGASLSDTVDVSFIPGEAYFNKTTIASAASEIAADGASTTVITVQAIDANDNLLTSGGDTVTLSTTNGSLSAVTDNNDGTYSATLTSNNSAGSVTLSGTLNGDAFSNTASVTYSAALASGVTSIVTEGVATLVADGSSSTSIVIQAKDVGGTNLVAGGDTVVLSTTAGELSLVSDLGNGSYSATLTSATSVANATISGTINGNAIVDTAVVSFIAGSAHESRTLINSTDASIVVGGATTIITVQAKDINGNDLTTDTDTVVLSTNLGSLGILSNNNDGTYSATLTSDTLSASATITGTINDNPIADNVVVSFTPGAANATQAIIISADNSVVANGANSTTVTIQLRDVYGNNLTTNGGATVAFSVSSGSLGPVSYVGDGKFQAALTSGISISTVTVGATVNSVVATDTAAVSFVADVANAGQSTLNYADASIAANGVTTTLITVQLKDVNGNNLAIGGETVVIATTSGSISTVTDKGDGTYTAILTSAQNPQTGTISASLNGTDISSTVQVQFLLDTDKDGLPNATDTDDDNDGVADASEVDSAASLDACLPDNRHDECDFDKDGDKNAVDLDDDNDGVDDVNELDESAKSNSSSDTDGDGVSDINDTAPLDSSNDTDLDGISNEDEVTAGTDPNLIDTDGDGKNDLVEVGADVNAPIDTDGDGIIDALESSTADLDSDGVVDELDDNNASGSNDSDGDGISNADEVTGGTNPNLADTDNDGVSDLIDTAPLDATNDNDSDGLNNAEEKALGLNPLISDTDNDGLNDLLEVGSNIGTPIDTDADGVIDAKDADDDGDTINTADELDQINADGDANPLTNPMDVDNDGIADHLDADTATLDGTGGDSDQDGLNDKLECRNQNPCADDDQDGTPNHMDDDSDNNGIDDKDEVRATLDTDGDGIADFADTNDDNDGQLDSAEISDSANPQNDDQDADGIPDYKDADGVVNNAGSPDGSGDSDNDGISDLKELGLDANNPLDSDQDNIPDYMDSDSDNDGISDDQEADGIAGNGNAGTVDPIDTDKDGISDASESNTSDADSDGVVDQLDDDNNSGTNDTDGDGISNTNEVAAGTNPNDAGDTPADNDGDGNPDALDNDDDNDGVSDVDEATAGTNPNAADSDGDGKNDVTEIGGNVNNPTDSDNDGVIDALESSTADADSDGVVDELDSNNASGTNDTDGDGISNANEVAAGTNPNDGGDTPADNDGDGNPDLLDNDDDNDGVSDVDEATAGTNPNAADSDGDGKNDATEIGGNVNNPTDSDNDGVIDALESSTADADSDGVVDELDSNNASGTNDTDGDGISNANEVAAGTNPNDGGDTPADNDGDGNPDALDNDDDNDGVSDADEATAGTNANAADSDGDGKNDAVEIGGSVNAPTDSDNDGVIDALESSTADADSDGVVDELDSNNASGTNDTDGDGISNANEVAAGTNPNDGSDTPTDNDGDGNPDALDNDDDNDGVSDADEVAEGTDPNNADSDNDGLNDAEEKAAGTDANNSDSDNDGVNDGIEISDGTDPLNADTDNDGVTDGQEQAVGTDPKNLDTDGDGRSDSEEGAADPVAPDADNDGIADFLDNSSDEDNDGIPDIIEGNQDTDEDGINDAFDTDSDNDGIPDAIESGLSGRDSDDDGIDDSLDVDNTGGVDANNDGIDDSAKAVDTDGDGTADYRDIDSDNDGASDTSESQIEVVNDGEKDVVIDSDGDGIADVFDVDSTGGADDNNDGVDDAVLGRDSDDDGVSDYLDLDSDNDGLLDVIEAGLQDSDNDGTADAGQNSPATLPDTDGDGVPDLRDTDSNGDGTGDINASPAADLDLDGDGRIDVIVDVDGDGISDSADDEPSQRGNSSDSDGDGINSSLDLDDDNDGISDLIEGDGDLDGDGIPNRSDNDSDGDGLADRFEANSPSPTGLDDDSDGIDNAFDVDSTGGVDANNDGIDDQQQAFSDVDGDGAADFLDADSDNDGISDNQEQMSVRPTGTDTDSDGIDDAYDVDQTGGVDANADGVDDSTLTARDTDGDGIQNFRDTDSDGDGIPDADEIGDYNGDGIPDYLQKDPGIETGISKIGSLDYVLVFPLLLLVLGRIKAIRKKTLLTLLAATVSLNTNADDVKSVCQPDKSWEFSFPGCWYVGGGLGLTNLQPTDNDSGWRLREGVDVGYKLHGGYHFLPHWFTEFSYTDLGEAKFENRNPNIKGSESISYTIPELSLGYFVFDPMKQNWNIFLKGGLAYMRNKSSSSRLPFDDINNTQLGISIGAQYQINENWFGRIEADSYSTDARYFGFSISRYFGKKAVPVVMPQEIPKEPADSDDDGVIDAEDVCPGTQHGIKVNPQGCIADADKDGVTDDMDACLGTAEGVTVTDQGCAADLDQDGIADDIDTCLETPTGIHVNELGCAVFEGVLKGVQFETNSAELTSNSKVLLNDVAAALVSYVDLKLEVQAHTDDRGKMQYNQNLSQRRAQNVVNYLVSQGVAAERLVAKGYGESQPSATNDTVQGRATNRRVEFIVLSEELR